LSDTPGDALATAGEFFTTSEPRRTHYPKPGRLRRTERVPLPSPALWPAESPAAPCPSPPCAASPPRRHPLQGVLATCPAGRSVFPRDETAITAGSSDLGIGKCRPNPAERKPTRKALADHCPAAASGHSPRSEPWPENWIEFNFSCAYIVHCAYHPNLTLVEHLA